MPSWEDTESTHSPMLQSSSDGTARSHHARVGQATDSNEDSLDESPGKSKTKKLSILTARTKAKTKKLFHSHSSQTEESDGDEDGVLKNIDHDAAFNPSTLKKQRKLRPEKVADKTVSALHSIGTAIVHPKEAIKSKATRTTAGQLSKAERPYLSQNADREFLEAHDELRRAESTGSSKQGTSDEEQESIIGSHRGRIREMEAHRQSLHAAWTMSRHVKRVRVVPKRHINFPDNEYFMERNERGEFVRFDWLTWLGYNLIYYTQDFSAQYIDDFDELPFNLDSSRHYIERLVLASAPWQSWAMDVRAVYRWEDPWITSKWFALYLFLWYTQHMMGFLYFYVIYIILKNRYYPSSVESIRESMRRAMDSQGTASKFGELIDKHGRHDWLDPVLDHLGPYVQLQLGDMANMLEVFSNFYHWKNPKKTVASLWFFATCLLISICTDMEFCMKIFWFIFGGSFFLCWPISSLYPKYRYLVSPFKWVLWDIPTHAEWSFQYLRRQAQIAREDLIKHKVEEADDRELRNPAADKYTHRLASIPKIMLGVDDVEAESEADDDNDDDEAYYSASSTTSVLEESDIRSFRAQYHNSIGRLIVFSKGVRFVRSFPKKELWRTEFLELAELRKVKGSKLKSAVSALSPSDQLEILCVDGSVLRLGGMRERDEAFNTVVAFSGLQWQSLQVESKMGEEG